VKQNPYICNVALFIERSLVVVMVSLNNYVLLFDKIYASIFKISNRFP